MNEYMDRYNLLYTYTSLIVESAGSAHLLLKPVLSRIKLWTRAFGPIGNSQTCCCFIEFLLNYLLLEWVKVVLKPSCWIFHSSCNVFVAIYVMGAIGESLHHKSPCFRISIYTQVLVIYDRSNCIHVSQLPIDYETKLLSYLLQF